MPVHWRSWRRVKCRKERKKKLPNRSMPLPRFSVDNSAGALRYYKQQGNGTSESPTRRKSPSRTYKKRKGHAAPKSNRLATFFAPGISSYPLPLRFIPLCSSLAFRGAPISSGGRARGASSAVGLGSFRVGVGRGREEKKGCERDCFGDCVCVCELSVSSEVNSDQ